MVVVSCHSELGMGNLAYSLNCFTDIAASSVNRCNVEDTHLRNFVVTLRLSRLVKVLCLASSCTENLMERKLICVPHVPWDAELGHMAIDGQAILIHRLVRLNLISKSVERPLPIVDTRH